MDNTATITSLDNESMDNEPIDKDTITYTIKTRGNRNFHVHGKILKRSVLLDTLIQETDETEFELNEIDGEIMCYVICYMEYITFYQDLHIPIHPGLYRKTTTTEWFYDFIEKFDISTTKKMIHVANYLHIESLMHLGCFRLAILS